ncbi:MAG: NAD-dependent epimerase/dehydratase family protein [Candidatus Lokiarchaeota archaeon]|nr:NAD-dependent epimerase/dehydratase family protein [Candidatus Lokiarchaeota archaeon]MBD3199629.1 NAD-dependent epimerase/dehydratase family protein [Candidatus Lokiarchaeota archaeon]
MNILVIGANGQIGSELVPALREKFGRNNVIAADKKISKKSKSSNDDKDLFLDVLNKESLEKIVSENDIQIIFHLAAILSAIAENVPQKGWDININGLMNILEVGRNHNIKKIIWPSSIAVFGPKTPKINTPNDTILRPTTMYGITKVSGELLINYYHEKYDLDVRSVRLPGIISNKTLPGGGTTDYAVEIFYEALKNKKYISFLKRDTKLPMMYMPDCISAMIMLLEAESSQLKRRVYNITSMSFSVEEIAQEIKRHIPEFVIQYDPDFRQEIANTWPESINDSLARKEWKWNPSYDLCAMTKDMIQKLKKRVL